MHRLLVLLGLCITLAHGPAMATADGPDTFSVTGVAEGDVLNIRSAPSARGAIVGEMPPDADGIANLGCIGGLTFEQWSTATEAEREAARTTRWCRVGHDRVIGWAAGWFLTEGTGGDAFNAGGRLETLAGSEWRLRDFAGDTAKAEAWIGLRSDGAVTGQGGCNRFTGKLAGPDEPGVFGLMASTRMACPPDQMETEDRFFEVLGAAEELVAHHLVMSMFDGDGNLLATFTRRDAD